MSSKLLIPLSALALVGCARHMIPQVTSIPQTRLGTEDFGPGIVAYGQLAMDFDLRTSGHVIVLRVSDVKHVEAVEPLRSGDRTELARGRHHVLAPELRFAHGRGPNTDASTCVWGAGSPYTEFDAAFDSTAAFRQAAASQQSYDDCVRHEQASTAMFGLGDGTSRQGETPNARYWLLIVSDVPTLADDLEKRLAAIEWPGSATTAVHSLPQALVGGRTTRWAAYYVLVGGSPTTKSGH